MQSGRGSVDNRMSTTCESYRRGAKIIVAIQSVAMVVVLLVQSGCALKKLESELTSFEDLAQLSGQISSGDFDNDVLLLLYADNVAPESLANYKVLPEDGSFLFYARPGNYYLVAFADENRNFRFDAGEVIGYYGNPELVEAPAGSIKSNLNIEKGSAGRLEGFAVDLSDAKHESQLSHFRENLGAVVDFDDHRLAREHGKTGLWKPNEFLSTVGGGIFFLEEYDPAKIPVLFVHGIAGTPQDHRYLVEHLDRERFQPWLLSYPSALRLSRLGPALEGVVDEMHTHFGFSEMAVVAHSMGGLVSRSFLNSSIAEKKREYVKLFVTISTPFGGHGAAEMGAEHVDSDWVSWIDMVPGSDFLDSLLEPDITHQLEHHLLFSFEGSNLFTEGNDDGAVSIASQLDQAAQAGAARIYGFDKGHVEILSDKRVSALLNQLLAEMQ